MFFGTLLSVAYALKATTTKYCDNSPGACGFKADYHSARLTAGGSQSLFGSGTWCGDGCSKCYKLTSSETSPPG